ncbi:MAG: retroviral-like aspartic protease family protein [Candidatus Eremiobacteraeota bacterium]|nr:retroviral-like aspartic protease family protein [Candidatus Eremiobacteraeota bacterium]
MRGFFASLVGLVVAYAAVPVAAAPLTAVQVLRRAAAAEGVLAPGAYRIVVRSKTGGLERMRTSYLNGDDYVAHEVGGPFVIADGSYRGRDWTQDENGIVSFPSGFADREDPNARALAHPENPRNAVHIIGTGAGPWISVELDPPDGNREVRSYDATSYLLVRDIVDGKDGLTHVDVYDDYRNTFGQMRAYHHTYSDGRPENDYSSSILTFARATPPLPDTHPPASRSLFTFTSNTPIVLPARMDSGRIIVRMTIAGRGLDFGVDTGSSAMTINPDVARELGLVAYDKASASLGGSYGVARTILPEMQIGRARLTNVAFSEVAVEDSMSDSKIVGLLGHDFFASGVFAIDFKHQRLTVYPPGTAPLADPALHKIAIETDEGVPRVPVSFEGVTGHFVLDTGAGNTVAYQHYYDRLPSSTLLPGTWTLRLVGGAVKAVEYQVEDRNFGGIIARDVPLIVPQSALGEIPGYDGLLGRDALSSLMLYLDYANGAMYAKENP